MVRRGRDWPAAGPADPNASQNVRERMKTKTRGPRAGEVCTTLSPRTAAFRCDDLCYGGSGRGRPRTPGSSPKYAGSREIPARDGRGSEPGGADLLGPGLGDRPRSGRAREGRKPQVVGHRPAEAVVRVRDL